MGNAPQAVRESWSATWLLREYQALPGKFDRWRDTRKTAGPFSAHAEAGM